MNISAEELDFLKAGVSRYVEAKATIDAFEQRIKTLLDEAIDNRQSYSPMSHKKTYSSREGGHSDFYIAKAILGTSTNNEEVEIDCGIWWNCRVQLEPILYANFYFKPVRVSNFKWNDASSDIKSFLYEKKRTVLYLPFPTNMEIAKPLNSLIDGLLIQL